LDKYDDTNARAFQTEVKLMNEMSHPNIIEMAESCDSAIYKHNDHASNVCYIALELATEKSIFDYIRDAGKFEESIARFYFHQLIEGIEYMHNHGIVHRDIKPENILLDSNFNLKIADFGLSTQKLTTSGVAGTECYNPPEAFKSANFEAKSADIFAAGIILFLMLKGTPPFGCASPQNAHYTVFHSKRSFFWKMHAKKQLDLFSKESIDLMNGMFEFESHRFTIEDVLKSEWYNGPLPSQDEVKQAMLEKKKLIAESAGLF